MFTNRSSASQWSIGAGFALLMGVTSIPVAASTLEGTAAAEQAGESVSTLLTDLVHTGSHYFVVGWRGHILRSEQGRNWEQAEVPVNVLLTAVDFPDAQYGWVVGHDGTILHSQDGGDNWLVQSFQVGLPPLLDVMFFDRQRGIAVGTYGAMMQTADGGATWAITNNAITDEGVHLNDLQRLPDGRVLLVGEMGMMAISDDDAQTWKRLQSPYDSSLFAAAPKGPKGAVVGGLRGNLFQTDDIDSGQWQQIKNESPQSIFGITELPDNRGHVLAALNGTLQTLSSTGRLKKLALDKDSAGIPPAPPSGPPYVFLLTDDVDQDVGAFTRAMPLNDGFLSVGDSGVRYWR